MTGPNSQIDETRMLRAAIRYAALGWAVFPLHTPTELGCSCRREGCSNTGKHPRTRNGFLDATTDQGQIAKWWEMWPQANIGVACGKSGIVVIDVDPRHGGDESFIDLCERTKTDLRETVIALTGGGGSHYIYRAPKDAIHNSISTLGPGIDVRGIDGYICITPSIHVSGERYSWERSPLEFEPAPFPADELVAQMPRREKASPIGDTIAAGMRDQTLTSLAGTMRRRGMGEDSILAALRAENASRCVPPLPDSDIHRIAHSVGRYAPSGDIPVSTGITTYQRLRKVGTEPPSYVLEVSGRDVKLTTAQLVSHTALRTAVLEQSDQSPARMKAVEWDDTLAVLLNDLEILPAPDDASEPGVAWQIIRAFLAAHASEDTEALERGRPFEEDNVIYATGNALRRALKAEGLIMTQRDIWAVMQAHGTKQQNKYIDGRQRWVWALPTAEIQ